MKVVAISQRVDVIERYHEKRDAVDQRWWDLLLQCELVPIIIPNCLLAVQRLLDKQPQPDGILLTGGNDTSERQKVEHFLLDKAISARLPVLGVCQGMQRIQNYFGVKLEKVVGHITAKQDIVIHGTRQVVNSYHELGTRETTADLKVWAEASDGVIKAIDHSHYPITGIMWHPERIHPFAERDIRLIHSRFYGANI